MGALKRERLRGALVKMPALRFRSKVTLGFGCLLIVSAISMGVAYFGFGRIAASVAASQAGVARPISPATSIAN